MPELEATMQPLDDISSARAQWVRFLAANTGGHDAGNIVCGVNAAPGGDVEAWSKNYSDIFKAMPPVQGGTLPHSRRRQHTPILHPFTR